MFDLALNRSTHDLVFTQIKGTSKFEIKPIEGADRVAQQVKITLLAFLGEWFLDNTFGVPYLEEILVKNPRLSSVHSILRSKIVSVPNVVRIEYLSLDFDRMRRLLDVDFLIDTDLGPIKDSLSLEVVQRV